MILTNEEKDILKEFNINDMVNSSDIAFKFDLTSDQLLSIINKLSKCNLLIQKPLNEINARHTSTTRFHTISEKGKEYLKNNP